CPPGCTSVRGEIADTTINAKNREKPCAVSLARLKDVAVPAEAHYGPRKSRTQRPARRLPSNRPPKGWRASITWPSRRRPGSVRPRGHLISAVEVRVEASHDLVVEGNCVAVRQGGEQPETNWRSVG